MLGSRAGDVHLIERAGQLLGLHHDEARGRAGDQPVERHRQALPADRRGASPPRSTGSISAGISPFSANSPSARRR